MKKRKLLILSVMLCLAMLIMAGCGGSPLSNAYKKLAKAAEENSSLTVRYSEATDTLEMSFDNDAAIDQAFEILGEATDGKDIGRICFNASDDSQLDYIVGKAGELTCNSIATFGIGNEQNANVDADFKPILEKTNLLYFDFLPVADRASSSVTSLERIALGDCSLQGISKYENLKEAAVGCYDMMHVPEEEADETAASGGGGDADAAAEETDPAAAEEDAAVEEAMGGDASGDADADAAAEGESEETADTAEAAEPVFSGGWVSYGVGNSNLERLLIMPNEKSYTTDEYGDAYLFYLQNYKPELLINAPGTELSYDSEGNVDASSLTEVSKVALPNLSDSKRAEIIDDVLMLEVEKVYKKAKKFDSKSGDPVIKGKALVAIVDPDEIYNEITWWNEDGYWPTKRSWPDSDSFIDILSSDDLDGKIPTPELSGDYDTFVYAYPVYSLYGSYTVGTKAYTLTYYCQVFDLKNKKAYSVQRIASDDPPYTIYYSGDPPKKESGKVKRSKVVKFIKKLKTK